MGIAEDLQIFDSKLKELIILYEQFFVGIERREPVKLLEEIEKLSRRYANVPINNTMYKHRYNGLVARLSSYRQHWNRILREIEEGRYSRDRFKARLHSAKRDTSFPKIMGEEKPQLSRNDDFERLYVELEKAGSGKAIMTREQLAATLEKQRPVLVQKLGTEDIRFRVVVEDGKPKIKAGLKPRTGTD